MLYDLAKSPRILLAAVILPLIYGAFVAMNTLSSPAQIFGISRNPDNVASSDAIGDMKNALAQERRLLAELEKEQSRLRLEVINRRKLHQEGQASKQQVHESEQQF